MKEPDYNASFIVALHSWTYSTAFHYSVCSNFMNKNYKSANQWSKPQTFSYLTAALYIGNECCFLLCVCFLLFSPNKVFGIRY